VTIPGFQLIDNVINSLKLEFKGEENIKFPEMLIIFNQLCIYMKQISSADNDFRESLQVYCRTSGALKEIMKFLIFLSSYLTDVFPAFESEIYKLIVSSVNLISFFIAGQRSSKLILLECKILSTLKAQFTFFNKAMIEKQLDYLESCVQLWYTCCCDDVCVKTRNSVLSDKTVYHHLGFVMGEIFLYTGKSDIKKNSLLLPLLMNCTKIFKELAFSTSIKTACSDSLMELGSIICALSLSIDTLRNNLSEGFKSLIEVQVESLLGLSQQECLREYFALEIVPISSSSSKKVLTAVQVLLDTISDNIKGNNFTVASNALACLMNASLETPV
jgi:hypothetical protein